MRFSEGNSPSFGKGIYTLAQNGTQNRTSVIVNGEGTDIVDNPSMNNRAKRKIITSTMILSLVDVAKELGDQEAVQQYWNAYHCQNNIVTHNHKVYGEYCKNRFCTVCTAIRKADIINRYYPTIRNWEDPHFVTLTVKTCKEDKLNEWVWRMYRAFELILNRCKKRHQRGKGIKLMGVKSLECNFNPVRLWYNPHFHIIVPNAEVAHLLRTEWMKQWKPLRLPNKWYNQYKYTNPAAQHIRHVDDVTHTLIETIKYGSKIFTEPDLKKKSQLPKDRMIYAKALHNIFQAMKGKRLFDRFGFHLPPQPKKQGQSKWVNQYEEWRFSLEAADWINRETGECLTGYLMPAELNQLLSECINKETS